MVARFALVQLKSSMLAVVGEKKIEISNIHANLGHCYILGKLEEVEILCFNNDYDVLDEIATVTNCRKLKIVLTQTSLAISSASSLISETNSGSVDSELNFDAVLVDAETNLDVDLISPTCSIDVGTRIDVELLPPPLDSLHPGFAEHSLHFLLPEIESAPSTSRKTV